VKNQKRIFSNYIHNESRKQTIAELEENENPGGVKAERTHYSVNHNPSTLQSGSMLLVKIPSLSLQANYSYQDP
jgi:hypothetical protein